MIQYVGLFARLIVPALALTPQASLSPQTPAQDRATLGNSTTHLLNDWPPLPYRVPIFVDTYLNIMSLPLWDPSVEKSYIEWAILEIADDIRTYYRSRRFLPSQRIFKAGDEDIEVQLGFFAPDMQSITFQTAKEIANELYELTNRYGARQIAWASIDVDSVVVSYMWLHFVPRFAASTS